MSKDFKEYLWGTFCLVTGGLALSCARDEKEKAERADFNDKKKALAHRVAEGAFIASAAFDFAAAIKTLATSNVEVYLWPEKK